MASSDESTMYDVVFETPGPMGIDIESSSDGRDAYVTASTNETIKAGHMLVAVNNESLNGLTFEEILAKVQGSPHPRTLSFSTKLREEDESLTEDKLPLPNDFFSEVPLLTEEEEELMKTTLQKGMDEALALLKNTDEETGLSFVKESQGVTIHSGQRDGKEVHLIRAKTQVPIGAKLFLDNALCETNEEYRRLFHILDPMFLDGQVIQNIPANWSRYAGKDPCPDNLQIPFYSVKWACYALPFPLWNRDFVWCELTTYTDDGYGLTIAMTIPRITDRVPQLEESHGLVRGSIGLSGYFFKNVEGTDPKRPMGENHMMTDTTYFLQVNPKGVIPAWAVNFTAANQGMNVLRVREFAEHQRRVLWFLYKTNPELNEAGVLTQTVDKEFDYVVHAEEGQTIVFEWVLEANDIGFQLEGPNGDILVGPDRTSSNMETEGFYGRIVAPSTGDYTFKWDNTFSWFTSKTLYHHARVLNRVAPE